MILWHRTGSIHLGCKILLLGGMFLVLIASPRAMEQSTTRQEPTSSSQAPSGRSAHDLGVDFYHQGNYAKAIEHFQQALQENPNDREAIQLLGLSYYSSGKPKEAIPLLEKVLSWYPRGNVDAAYVLGQCYVHAMDLNNARKAFAKMYDRSPDSAASYLFTGQMLLHEEFFPMSEEQAKKAIELDPKLPMAHYLLGQLYLLKSEHAEAAAEFNKELEINPGNALAYYKLADAYSRMQSFDEAERLLKQSIWLDSTSTGPYILLGKILSKKGEPDLASQALQHAISMDPNNSGAHYLLGQAYRELGRNQESSKEFAEAQRLKVREQAPDLIPQGTIPANKP